MPSSHWRQIENIIDIIYTMKPKSVLDIGCGNGKYGFLTREYLDLWGEQEKNIQLDGIEIYEPYLTKIHYQLYDKIIVGDVRKVLNNLIGKYDLALMIDIIEHFDKNEAFTIIFQCLSICDNLLIATPKLFYKQNDCKNIYEQHLSHWKEKDFKSIANDNIFFHSNKRTVICLIGKDSEEIRKLILQKQDRMWKRLIKKIFAVIFFPYGIYLICKKTCQKLSRLWGEMIDAEEYLLSD